jgi:hypothetical protein
VTGTDAFYELDGERFVSTEWTRGPWDPDSQHAGPPAALLGRAIERLEGGEDRHVGRITFEILRPVPIAPLQASARVVRPGRRVELCEASLSDGENELIRATAWRLRTTTLDLPADSVPLGSDLAGTGGAPPGPGAGEPRPFFPTGQEVGWHTAMEFRFIRGSYVELGPALVWMRMRHALIAGEDPSPLTRVLVAADAGNGVSSVLDWTRYLFINVDLTVHLHRMPEGEWVCIDALTLPERSGVGLADSLLSDETGRIGRAAQTLLVDVR